MSETAVALRDGTKIEWAGDVVGYWMRCRVEQRPALTRGDPAHDS